MKTECVLAIVANRTQWETLREIKLPQGALLASFDFDLTVCLRQSGYDVFDLFTLVSSEEIQAFRDEAYRICDGVARAYRGRITVDGCDLVDRCCYDAALTLTSVLLQDAVIDRALRRFSPAEVWCFGERERVVFWDPARVAPDSFNALVARRAEKHGIRVRTLRDVCENARDYEGYESGWLEDDVQYLRHTPLGKHVKTLVFSCGMLYEHTMLLEALSETQRSETLVIAKQWNTFRLPQITLQMLCALPFGEEQVDRDIRAARDASPFRDTPAGDDVRWSDVRDCDYLQQVWASFCSRLAMGLRFYRIGRFLRDALEPDVVITGYDVFGQIRCFQEAFLTVGTPVVALDHTGLGMKGVFERHMGAKASCAVWGQYMEEGHKRCRSSDCAVRVVGSFRRDLHRLRQTRLPVQHLPHAGKKSVVLFLSSVSRLWGALVDTTRCLESWSELADLAKRRTDIAFVVKAHPWFYDKSIHEHFIRESDGLLRVEQKATSSGVLGTADAAVLVNCVSTTGIEAMMSGVPVFVLNDTMPRERVSPALVSEGVVHVRSVADLESEMDRLFSDLEYRERYVSALQAGARRIIAATGDEAVARLDAFVKELRVQAPPSTRETGVRLCFDACFPSCSTKLLRTLARGTAALRKYWPRYFSSLSAVRKYARQQQLRFITYNVLAGGKRMLKGFLWMLRGTHWRKQST